MELSEVRPTPIAVGTMIHALAENWWLILLRGLCAIAFGILAFVWPGVTVMTLVIMYGAFALADGILALIAAVKGEAPAPRWWLALVGLIGIAAGAMTFLWPGITALILLLLIASWSIVSGIFQIIGAIRLRKEIEGEWLLIASGVISVLFGILLILRPEAGALALISVIGAFAIVYGALIVGFSLRLRRHLGQGGQPGRGGSVPA